MSLSLNLASNVTEMQNYLDLLIPSGSPVTVAPSQGGPSPFLFQ